MVVVIIISILWFIFIICSMCSVGKDEKIEGYHSEASDSQGGVLWVSDTDPNDSFWG